jgi:gamma-glutamylcyclotransferase (GGCT)/AIG2-like uncharacterized protein YtfP
MNQKGLYAFYGSLRRGMDNYERYKKALDYQFSARLNGYRLYSMGQYPCVVKSSAEYPVLVEIFRVIDPFLEKEIYEMEIDEGYFYEEVIVNGKSIGIYVFETHENFTEIPEGDWVTFFGERSKSLNNIW